MSKVALIIVGGCVFFGLLKLVASEDLHVDETDIQNAEDVPDDNDQQERMPFNAKAMAFAGAMGLSRPNILPSPSPVPISLTECYVCTDCPKVMANTTSKLCPYTLDSTKRGKCVVYAEQYKHMKRPWYIRGCASERGSCADIRRAHASHADIVTLLLCNECDGDRCNVSGASRSIADITMAFFALVVTPLLTKYTLS